MTFRARLVPLVRAGLLTGAADGLFSSVLSVVFYHSTVTRLFQGVASVLLGARAFDEGTPAAAVGLMMHFGVAFAWSAVFVALAPLPWVRRLVHSRFGVLKAASLYGPFIWTVMSVVIIPLLVHRPPAINVRWWVQFIGHIPFVAVPIVGAVSFGSPRVEHVRT
jgi:hypothetical protein